MSASLDLRISSTSDLSLRLWRSDGGVRMRGSAGAGSVGGCEAGSGGVAPVLLQCVPLTPDMLLLTSDAGPWCEVRGDT